MTDTINALIIFPLIGILIFNFEYLARKEFLDYEISRKLLHLSIGIIASFSPFIFELQIYPLAFGVTSLVFNIISLKYGILKSLDPKSRKSYGTVYFSLSFIVLICLLWEHKLIILISFLLFSIGDFFAGLSEKIFSKKILLDITDEPKTFHGAISNFLSTIIIYYFIYYLFYQEFDIFKNSLAFFILCIMTATISTVIEILSQKGTDNLFLPLFLSLFTFISLNTSNLFPDLLLGFSLGAFIAAFSIKFKLLSKNGALTTFLLAMFVYGLGGWKWTLPIFSFFILSSFLSKFSEKIYSKTELYKSEKESKRDMWQVLANGAIPFIIILLDYFFVNSNLYFIFLVVIAVHTSDTWSTETGTAFGKNVFMITTFKRIKRGESGGVSVIGSFFGILGAFVIILIGNYFVNLNVKTFFILVLFGFLGNLIDSLFGATIQAKYECNKCHKPTEKKKHCNSETSIIKGYKIINNDFVNFSSALIILIISAIFLL